MVLRVGGGFSRKAGAGGGVCGRHLPPPSCYLAEKGLPVVHGLFWNLNREKQLCYTSLGIRSATFPRPPGLVQPAMRGDGVACVGEVGGVTVGWAAATLMAWKVHLQKVSGSADIKKREGKPVFQRQAHTFWHTCLTKHVYTHTDM